ncbi:outer membrane beta-barrel protein [Winogradskyella sp. SM1960]|uniref:outer membrane beta-barrel protein n=1 Tax=Winogradskyella sp. SM1960 TaxID=2865955 RepID=UPI001CD1D5DE|nr:outer membrane beta-barrel protein [Winogradskyella sp. SM1960]
MKHSIIVVLALLLSLTSYAQFQVSASGGYAIGSAGMKIGEIQTVNKTENTYGSYGEGLNTQIRGTYFFNDTFGADLSLGYLHGDDQTVSEINAPGVEVDAVARARAFGAALSLVYKFNNNVYGRLGALVKLGGKTEAVAYQNMVMSDDQAAGLSQAYGTDIPSGSSFETNFVEDYHGQFPLGFVAAIGYEYPISTNFSVFAEAEYYGISLKRKDSEIVEFNTDIVRPDGTTAVQGFYSLNNLPEGTNRTTTYVDEIAPEDNYEGSSKELAVKVPYSSFGINFGITYKFKSASAATTR